MKQEVKDYINRVDKLCESMTLTITDLPTIDTPVVFMPRWEYGTLYEGKYDGNKFIRTDGKEFDSFMDTSRWIYD